MSAVKGASLEMAAPLEGEMKSMQIGLGAALNAAAAEAQVETSPEGSLLRRRRRFAVMACLGAVSLIFVMGVTSLRSYERRSDEWSSRWPLRAEILAASGAAGDALAPVEVSRSSRVRAGGVDFVVLLADGGAKAKAAGDEGGDDGDPFAPAAVAANPALLVRETVFGAYALVLNKFPALPHHALLVTKAFAPQDWRLTKADLDALHRCAAAADALGFYNSDAVAGASQPHRHFQLVFNDAFGDVLVDDAGAAPAESFGVTTPPIQAAIDLLPREDWAWSAKAPFAPKVRSLAALDGIAHGVVQLPERATYHIDFQGDGGFDVALLRAYAALLGALDLFEQPPYNLLLSRRWMLVVKRAHRDGEGVDINALGYAGCLLARDEAAFDALAARGGAGPLAALRAAAVPRAV